MPVQQLPVPCWSLWPVKPCLPMMPPLGESDVHPNTPPRCSRLRYQSPWPALRGREKTLTPLYALCSCSQLSLKGRCVPHFLQELQQSPVAPLSSPVKLRLFLPKRRTGQASSKDTIVSVPLSKLRQRYI